MSDNPGKITQQSTVYAWCPQSSVFCESIVSWKTLLQLPSISVIFPTPQAFLQIKAKRCNYKRAATINRNTTDVWVNWKHAIQKDPDTPTSDTQLQILGIFTVQLNHLEQLNIFSQYTVWSMLAIAGTTKEPSLFPQSTCISTALKCIRTSSSLFILQIFAAVRRFIKIQTQKFKNYFSLFLFKFNFHRAPLVHPWRPAVPHHPGRLKTKTLQVTNPQTTFIETNCCVFCQGKVCVGSDGNRAQNYETST